jgi:hypothetical protein
MGLCQFVPEPKARIFSRSLSGMMASRALGSLHGRVVRLQVAMRDARGVSGTSASPIWRISTSASAVESGHERSQPDSGCLRNRVHHCEWVRIFSSIAPHSCDHDASIATFLIEPWS